MTLPADLFATERAEPAFDAGERAQLEGWVDYHRATLLTKCAGLSADQLRTASCPPSTLTLLGLVRHLAEVEGWFNDDLTDGPVPPIFYSEQQPDGDFENVADADIESDVATFRRMVERSRTFAARTPDLDTVCARNRRTGEPITLRWIYHHMIEEYARHNGHADLLRQALDGATGE